MGLLGKRLPLHKKGNIKLMASSTIPTFPVFAEPNLVMKDEVDSFLSPLKDGASELSFLNLYLFRHTYHYSFSLADGMFIIKGIDEGIPFVITPCGVFHPEIVAKFLDEGFRWNCITDEFLSKNRSVISKSCMKDAYLEEDRNNFDYVYLANSLATLPGKDLHKKKTHINKFEKTYPLLKVLPLSPSLKDDALSVLQQWKAKRSDVADFEEACEALSLLGDERFCIRGVILYIEATPVAWSIAEVFKERDVAVVLFEKALDEYKGSFQYINYALATHLADEVKCINREQDLGDAGLRQAKMTYRPLFFVKKYVSSKTHCDLQ